LLRTYTLYLRGHDGADRFEPAMCRTDVDAMARARLLLAQNPDCRSIDAYFGDQHLFSVAAPNSDGE